MKKNNYNISVLLICLVMIFYQNNVYSQVLTDCTKHNSIKSVTTTVSEDVIHVISAPLRITQKDGLKLLALTTVATGCITLFDNPIDNAFSSDGYDKNEENKFLYPAKGLAKVGNVYDKISSPYLLAGLTTSMVTGGLILKNKKLLQTSRLMVESYLLTLAITGIGKGISGRARPYTENDPTTFELFKFSKTRDYRSFPSGHTSSAFSMMTVLAKQYDQWWIKIPAYTLGVSVALQRIDSRNHWGADVIVGGALGYWVGSTLVNRHKNISQNITFNPYISSNGLGVCINF